MVLLLFLLLAKAQICYCCTRPDPKWIWMCRETQLGGLSISHLLVYMMLGYLYPNDFFVIQTIGILFEIVELYMMRHKNAMMWIGGCFYYPRGQSNTHQPIDEWVMGEDSFTDFWWHFKITDVLMNMFGFFIGMLLSNS